MDASTWQQRYNAARYRWFCEHRPNVVKDGHYYNKKINPAKEKDLAEFIITIIRADGYRANDMRKSAGLLTKEAERQESGTILIVKKFKKTGVKKGLADVSSTIKGRSYQWEIKIGRDRPSEHQLERQREERQAGGSYEFVHTPEEFLDHYDRITNSNT
jgi:hypothetical protein